MNFQRCQDETVTSREAYPGMPDDSSRPRSGVAMGGHMSEISNYRGARILRCTNSIPALFEARAFLDIIEVLLEPRTLLTRQSIP